MADDQKLSDLTAVTTPAATDQFYVNQGGTSKMMTREQVHTLESGEHLILPSVSEQATPTLAFGDGDSGFFELAANRIAVSINGADQWEWTGSRFVSRGGSGANLDGANSTVSLPSFSFNGDLDLGMWRPDTDILAFTAGGVETCRYTELSSKIIKAEDSNVGLTAHTDSGQGDGPILSSYNEYSVVAVAGDAATLPAVFVVGTQIWAINNGAQSMDVFPATDDDAGGGANVAVAVAAGARAMFLAIAANATWTAVFNA